MTKKRYSIIALALGAALLMTFTGCHSSYAPNPADNPAAHVLDEDKDSVTKAEDLPAASDEGTELGYQLDMPEKGEEVVVMTTSMGDISIRLFPQAAPKTVYNFKKLAQQGYYDGLTFHRVIKDFMIQGGDPEGTGAGGESVWGGTFEDEFSKNLVNLRGSLSMANSGSNTNGSQFFINQAGPVDSSTWDTVESTYNMFKSYSKDDQQIILESGQYTIPNADLLTDAYKKLYEENGGNYFLDGSYNAFDPQRGHTVFGQVFDGMDVVDKIAAVDTDGNNKPTEDVTIEKVEIVEYEG